MARNTWASNFGKSVKFGAVEAAKELNPAITKLYNENKEFMTNLANTLSDINKGQGSILRSLERSESGKVLLDSAAALKSDLKNFWKTGSIPGTPGGPGTKDPAAAMGLDMGDMGDMGGGSDFKMDEDVDFGSDNFNFDDLPSPEEAMGGASPSSQTPEAAAITGSSAAEIVAINKGTLATAKSGADTARSIAYVGNSINAQTGTLAKSIANNTMASAQLNSALITAQQSMFSKTNEHLKMINDNLANMIQFNNDTNAKLAMGALKYFDDSLALLTKISAGIERMSPEKQEEQAYETDYEKALGYDGTLRLGGYLDVIKSNLQKTDLAPIVGFLENPGMLAEALANPLMTLTQIGMKSIVPKIVKGAMSELNYTLENFFPALLSKFAAMGNDFSQNPMFQMIGKILGVETPSTQINLGQYEKGPVPFDGITHKTINQVIPTYLSKIVALLSGGEERIFNYQTGTFETRDQLRQRLEAKDRTNRSNALGYAGDELNKAMELIAFETEAQQENFRQSIEAIRQALTYGGKFVNFNKESDMDDLYNLAEEFGFSKVRMQDNAAIRSFMTEFIRRMPRRMQVELAASGVKYANNSRSMALREMKNGSMDYNFAGDNFDDYITANDVTITNAKTRQRAPKISAPVNVQAPIFGIPQTNVGGNRGAAGQIRAMEARNQAFFDEVRAEQNKLAKTLLEQQIQLKEINAPSTGVRPEVQEFDDEKRLKSYRDKIRQGFIDLDDIAYGGADYAFDQLEERNKERKAEQERQALMSGKHGFDPKKHGLDPNDPYDAEKIEEMKRENESALETVERYAMQPAKLLTGAIKTIDDTLYRVLFGATEDEGSIIHVLINNIKTTFSNLKDWLYKDIFQPLKRWFVGDDFTQTKFYKAMTGMFSKLKGDKNKEGYYANGLMSDVFNEFKDSTRAIRNVVSGQGYTDSHGNKHEENKDSVVGNMREGVNEAFGSFKNYWGVGQGEEDPNAWQNDLMNSLKGSGTTSNKSGKKPPVSGNKATGGAVPESGTYILSKGEKVIKGNYALGTVPATGAYDLKAGDQVVPNKDVVKDIQGESSFMFNILNKTYGSISDKLDNVVSAINETTNSIKSGFSGTKEQQVAMNATLDNVNATAKQNTAQNETIDLHRQQTEAKINNLISSITTLDGTRKEKKPMIDVIFDKIMNSGAKFAGAIGGSRNFDNTYIQKDYMQAIRKKAPKAIAHGALAGGGLALAGAAGSGVSALGPFGALSFFLPGGPFSAMLVGMGLGVLHQHEGFMNMMYGKKDEKGERQGGIISKRMQKFFKENKTGLIGGAAMGLLNGFTGFSVLKVIGALLPGGAAGALGTIGAVPSLGIGLLGPVLFYSAAGVALKSKKVQKMLFGTGDPKDGKKATGALNGAAAKKIKRILPNVAVGAGLGALAGGFTSSMGILGTFALGPYSMALLGGAAGLGMASDKFKDAIFGKYDEKQGKFVSGGLVDTMKNAIKGEILKPVSVFAEKSFAKMQHFITTDIMVPLGKAFYPYVALFKTIFDSITTKIKGIFTGVGNSIYKTFDLIMTPIKFLAKKAWDWTWGASKTLLNSIFGIAGAVIKVPMKMIQMTGNIAGFFSNEKYQAEIENAHARMDAFKEDQDFKFEQKMMDLDEREAAYKQERKEGRKRGWEATQEQLDEKTAQYHAELKLAEEAKREAEGLAEKRRAKAEEQRNELIELLKSANLKLAGFTEEGKAILESDADIKDKIEKKLPEKFVKDVKSKSSKESTSSKYMKYQNPLTYAASKIKDKLSSDKDGSTYQPSEDIPVTTEDEKVPPLAVVKKAPSTSVTSRKSNITSVDELDKRTRSLFALATGEEVSETKSPANIIVNNVDTKTKAKDVENSDQTEKLDSAVDISNNKPYKPKQNTETLHKQANRNAKVNKGGSGSASRRNPAGNKPYQSQSPTLNIDTSKLPISDQINVSQLQELIKIGTTLEDLYRMVEYKFDNLLGESIDANEVNQATSEEIAANTGKSDFKRGLWRKAGEVVLQAILLAPQLSTIDELTGGGLSRGMTSVAEVIKGGAHNKIWKPLKNKVINKIGRKFGFTMNEAEDYKGPEKEKDPKEELLKDIKDNITTITAVMIKTREYQDYMETYTEVHLSYMQDLIKAVNDINIPSPSTSSSSSSSGPSPSGEPPVGSHAGGGIIKRTGTYLLSAGEKVLAKGKATAKDISNSAKGEAEFMMKFLNKLYGSLADKFDKLIDVTKDIPKQTGKAFKSVISSFIGGKTTVSTREVSEAELPPWVKEELGLSESGGSSAESALDIVTGKESKKKPTVGKPGLARDADKDVGSILGKRNYENIMKERKEETFRQDLLSAIRGIGANFGKNVKEKKDSILDKLMDAFDTIKTFLGAAGILGALKSLYDLFTGKGGIFKDILDFLKNIFGFRDGDGEDGENGYHENDLNRDVVGRFSQSVIRHGNNLLRSAGTSLDGLVVAGWNKISSGAEAIRDRFRTGSDAYAKHAELKALAEEKGNQAAKLEQHIADLKANGNGTAEEASKIKQYEKELEQLKNEEKTLADKASKLKLQSKFHPGNMSVKEIIRDENASLTQKIINLGTAAVEWVIHNPTINKILGVTGMKTLGNALKGLVGSITESAVAKNAAKWSLRFFEGVGRMVGGGATGGALTVALGVYDAYEGANNAATLFRVKPEDVSFKMTMVASVFNVLMHFPLYIWIIDLMLEIAYYVSGGEIDVKPILLKMICDAIGLEDNVGELQAKYKAEYAEFAKKTKETEGENADVSMDRYNETLDNSYTPVADWIRQNVPGGTLLTGKNAADGTFRHGLMSGVGRAVEENPWYMNLIPGVPLIQGAKNFLIGDTTEDGREEKGILSDVQVFGKTVNQRIDEIFGDNGTFTIFINNTKSTIDEKYEAVFGEEGSFTKFYNGLKSDFDIKYDELLGENGTITKAWDEFSRDGGTFDTFTTELGKDMVAGWEWLFGVKDEKGNTVKGNVFERAYDSMDHFFNGDKNSSDEYLQKGLCGRIQANIEQGANDIETWWSGSYNKETGEWEKLPLFDRITHDMTVLMNGGTYIDGTINERGVMRDIANFGYEIQSGLDNNLRYFLGDMYNGAPPGTESGFLRDFQAGLDNNLRYLFGDTEKIKNGDYSDSGVIGSIIYPSMESFRNEFFYIFGEPGKTYEEYNGHMSKFAEDLDNKLNEISLWLVGEWDFNTKEWKQKGLIPKAFDYISSGEFYKDIDKAFKDGAKALWDGVMGWINDTVKDLVNVAENPIDWIKSKIHGDDSIEALREREKQEEAQDKAQAEVENAQKQEELSEEAKKQKALYNYRKKLLEDSKKTLDEGKAEDKAKYWNLALGGGIPSSGTYLLSKGEKVIKGNYASGTIPSTGLYDLNKGDQVIPTNDINRSIQAESAFTFNVLQDTYGSLVNKLDDVVNAVKDIDFTPQIGESSANNRVNVRDTNIGLRRIPGGLDTYLLTGNPFEIKKAYAQSEDEKLIEAGDYEGLGMFANATTTTEAAKLADRYNWDMLSTRGVAELISGPGVDLVNKGLQLTRSGAEASAEFNRVASNPFSWFRNPVSTVETLNSLNNRIDPNYIRNTDIKTLVKNEGGNIYASVITVFQKVLDSVIVFLKNSSFSTIANFGSSIEKFRDFLSDFLVKKDKEFLESAFSKFFNKLPFQILGIGVKEILQKALGAGFGVLGAIQGADEAAEIFEVDKEDLRPNMVLTCAIFGALCSIPQVGLLFLILEIALDCVYDQTGFRKWLIQNIYKYLTPFSDKADLEDLQAKSNQGFEEWLKEDGNEGKTKDDYYASQTGKEWYEWIRDGASDLIFGTNLNDPKNKPTKNYRLTGGLDDKGNYQEGLLTDNPLAKLYTKYIAGEAATDTYAGSKGLLTEELEKLSAYIFGEADTEGYVGKDGIILGTVKNAFNEGVDYLFGPKVEGAGTRDLSTGIFGKAVTKVTSDLTGFFGGVSDTAIELKSDFTKFKDEAIKTIKDKGLLEGGFDIIKNILKGVLEFDLSKITRMINKSINDGFKAFSEAFDSFGNFGKSIKDLWKKAKDLISKTSVSNIMSAIMPGFLDGILNSDMISKITNSLQGVFNTLTGAKGDSSIPKPAVDIIKPASTLTKGGGSGKGKSAFKFDVSDAAEIEALGLPFGGSGTGLIEQADSAYANEPIFDGMRSYGNMEDMGCGIASLAQVSNDSGLAPIDVEDARSLVQASDLAADGSGLTSTYMAHSVAQMGGTLNLIDPNDKRSMDALANSKYGYNYVAGGANELGAGHWISGSMGGSGKVVVKDPLGMDRSGITSTSNLSDFVNAGGPSVLGVVTPPGVGLPSGVKSLPVGGSGRGGGGNVMSVVPQQDGTCTIHSTKNLLRAYLGKEPEFDANNTAYFGSWYSWLTGGKINSQVKEFSKHQRSEFESAIKSHFDAKPENPIFLYQTGGDGNRGPGKPITTNRVSGNHATVIGRKLANGKYEDYDSNGGNVWELALNEIFDPTANGSAGNGTGPSSSNMLIIPTIDPSSPITEWKGSKGTSADKVAVSGSNGPANETDSSGNTQPATEVESTNPLAKLFDSAKSIIAKGMMKYTDLMLGTSHNLDDNATTDTSVIPSTSGSDGKVQSSSPSGSATFNNDWISLDKWKKLDAYSTYMSDFAKSKWGTDVPTWWWRTIMRAESGPFTSHQAIHYHNFGGMNYEKYMKDYGGKPATEKSAHGNIKGVFPDDKSGLEAEVAWFLDPKKSAHDWWQAEIAATQANDLQKALDLHENHYVYGVESGHTASENYMGVGREEFKRGNIRYGGGGGELGLHSFMSGLYGGGAANTDKSTDPYGKGVSMDPEGPKGLPMYKMWDTRWKDKPYSPYKTITQSGCAPTSMSMLASWVTKKGDITPDVVADWSYKNGHYPGSGGTKWSLFDSYAKTLGFGMKQVDSKEELAKAVETTPIVNSQQGGKFNPTGAGHLIVIGGKRKDGTYMVYDPNKVDPGEKIDENTMWANSVAGWIPEGDSVGKSTPGGTPSTTASSDTKVTPISSSTGSGSIDIFSGFKQGFMEGFMGTPASSGDTGSPSGDGSSTPAGSVVTKDKMSEEEIWDWFRSKGYDADTTTGIMARLKQENGYKATYEKFTNYNGKGGESVGFGMFQWTYDDGHGYDHPDPLGKDKEWAYSDPKASKSRLVNYMKWVDENKKGNYESNGNELEYFYEKDLKNQEWAAKRSGVPSGGYPKATKSINSWYPQDFNPLDKEDSFIKFGGDFERGIYADGSSVLNEIYNKYKDRALPTGNQTSGDKSNATQGDIGYKLRDEAMWFVNNKVPYLMGGCRTNHIDCSGLVQYCCKKLGILISRDADHQWIDFKNNGFLTKGTTDGIKVGDIVWFKGSDGTADEPGHVGIADENGYFIEAPGAGKVCKKSKLSDRSDFMGFGDIRKYAAKKVSTVHDKKGRPLTSGGLNETAYDEGASGIINKRNILKKLSSKGAAGLKALFNKNKGGSGLKRRSLFDMARGGSGKGLADVRGEGIAGSNGELKPEEVKGIVIHHLGLGDPSKGLPWDNNDYSADDISAKFHRGQKPEIPNGVGYHFVVRQGGDIDRGRKETVKGAHARHDSGMPYNLDNENAYGIVLSGTFEDQYQPTSQQLDTTSQLIADLSKKYNIPIDKDHVIPHSQTSNTGCPGHNLTPKIPSIIEEAKKKTPGASITPATSGNSSSDIPASTGGDAQTQTNTGNSWFDRFKNFGRAVGKIFNNYIDATLSGTTIKDYVDGSIADAKSNVDAALELKEHATSGGTSITPSGYKSKYVNTGKYLDDYATYMSDFAAEKYGKTVPTAFWRIILNGEQGITNDEDTSYHNNPGGMDYADYMAKEFGAHPSPPGTKDNSGTPNNIARFDTIEHGLQCQVDYFCNDKTHDWAKKELELFCQGKHLEAFRLHNEHYIANGKSLEQQGYWTVIPQQLKRGLNLRTGDDQRTKSGGGGGGKGSIPDKEVDGVLYTDANWKKLQPNAVNKLQAIRFAEMIARQRKIAKRTNRIPVTTPPFAPGSKPIEITIPSNRIPVTTPPFAPGSRPIEIPTPNIPKPKEEKKRKKRGLFGEIEHFFGGIFGTRTPRDRKPKVTPITSSISMTVTPKRDFSSWKGGEYFNDVNAVNPIVRKYLKGEATAEQVMAVVGITDPNKPLTLEQQQALGFREWANGTRTWQHFLLDSSLWRDGSGMTAVDSWLKAHPEAQWKPEAISKSSTTDSKKDKQDKAEDIVDKDTGKKVELKPGDFGYGESVIDPKDNSEPAQLARKLGVKFDGLGNIKDDKVPSELRILATDDNNTKYTKQGKQLAWKKAQVDGSKPSEDKKKKEAKKVEEDKKREEKEAKEKKRKINYFDALIRGDREAIDAITEAASDKLSGKKKDKPEENIPPKKDSEVKAKDIRTTTKMTKEDVDKLATQLGVNFDELGNIKEFGAMFDELKITAEDSPETKLEKQANQLKRYQAMKKLRPVEIVVEEKPKIEEKKEEDKPKASDIENKDETKDKPIKAEDILNKPSPEKEPLSADKVKKLAEELGVTIDESGNVKEFVGLFDELRITDKDDEVAKLTKQMKQLEMIRAQKYYKHPEKMLEDLRLRRTPSADKDPGSLVWDSIMKNKPKEENEEEKKSKKIDYLAVLRGDRGAIDNLVNAMHDTLSGKKKDKKPESETPKPGEDKTPDTNIKPTDNKDKSLKEMLDEASNVLKELYKPGTSQAPKTNGDTVMRPGKPEDFGLNIDFYEHPEKIPEVAKKLGLEFDEYGNIKGLPNVPEFNIATKDDDLLVRFAKQRAQMQNYVLYGGKLPDVIDEEATAKAKKLREELEAKAKDKAKKNKADIDKSTAEDIKNKPEDKKPEKQDKPKENKPKRKNFIQKGLEAIGNFLGGIFGTRKPKNKAEDIVNSEVVMRPGTPKDFGLDIDLYAHPDKIPEVINKLGLKPEDFDELGNIKGLPNVPDYNIIKWEDDQLVRFAKQRAQIQNYVEYGGKLPDVIDEEATAKLKKKKKDNKKKADKKKQEAESKAKDIEAKEEKENSDKDKAKDIKTKPTKEEEFDDKNLKPGDFGYGESKIDPNDKSETAELARKLGVKFDLLGNIKDKDVPNDLRILSTDDTNTKYSKQAKQLEWKKNKSSDTNAIQADPNKDDKTTANDIAKKPEKPKTESKTELKPGDLGYGESVIDANNNSPIAKLARELGITFDELGNVKGVDIPSELQISRSDNDTVKYTKQAKQIANYKKWKEGSATVGGDRETSDSQRQANNSSSNTKNGNNTAEVKTDAGNSSNWKIGEETQSALINAIREISIKNEAGMMVALLQTIASNQEKMNKYLADVGSSIPNPRYFDNATGNNYGGNHNARNINYNPSVPATQGLERKAYSNPDMNKQHAKNIKIANPGSV